MGGSHALEAAVTHGCHNVARPAFERCGATWWSQHPTQLGLKSWVNNDSSSNNNNKNDNNNNNTKPTETTKRDRS